MCNLKSFQQLAKNLSILYVEDEQKLQDKLKIYLQKFFNKVIVASNGKDGLALYKQSQFDIVLTDIAMPYLNGIEMAKIIKTENKNQSIIFISAYSDTNYFIESIKIGVDGYILKPIDYTQLNDILYKTVEKINKFKFNISYEKNLEYLVSEKTKEVKQLHNDQIETYKQILYALVNMIEERDTYTGGHSQRVAKYSYSIAKEFGLSAEKCDIIYQAGILHDIGKIVIPDIILLKPDKLTNHEYEIMQEHVNLGVEMINKIPSLRKLAIYIAQHHERLDGSGYPNKLKDDQIYIESQILGISDIFDAMTTSRIYSTRKNIEDVILEIKSLSGKHFRKDIVDVATKVLSGVEIDIATNQLPKTQLEKARFAYFYKN